MASNTEPTKTNNVDAKGGFDFSVDENAAEAKPKAPSENTTPNTSAEAPARNTGPSTTTTTTTTTATAAAGNPQPQIPGDSAPFIVLCGPPSSGKSMVLKCLATYLYDSRENGYTIAANRTLLNTPLYLSHCDFFDNNIGNPNIRMPNTVDYLMADIFDRRGTVVAHFLEAPGEDFFSLNHSDLEPAIPFKAYLTRVAQVTPNVNRKVIYIILLDLDSETSFRRDPRIRGKYEQKMVRLYNTFVVNHPSRVILLYNKVDIPYDGLWGNAMGCTNPEAVRADAEQNYPHLFFQRRWLFWNFDDFSFLPFCTGSYPDDGSYTAAGPVYPAALWKEITKRLL